MPLQHQGETGSDESSSDDDGSGLGCGWRTREVGHVQSEVERRLAQVRGLVPHGGRDEPSGKIIDGTVDPRGLAVDLSVGMGLEQSSSCVAASTLHEDCSVTAVPERVEEHARLDEYYLFWVEDSRPICLKLTAVGHWLGSQWPRCRLSQMRLHISESHSRNRGLALHEEQAEQSPLTPKSETNCPGYDRCRDLFILSRLQHSILKKFVRCSRQAPSVCSRSEGRSRTPQIVELLDAAAEVLAELCTVVVCHLNGLYPESGGGAQRQAKMLRMMTWTPQQMPEQSHQRFHPFSRAQHKTVKGASGSSIMGSEHAADTLPSALDPTPWDGPTSAQDSLQLWHAVRRQNLREVQEELLKIGQQSESRGDPRWASRVLEHRRRFRHPSNPKPLTGTVLLLALQELDEAMMKADAFDDTAVKIFKELVSGGADPEAMYKVEECGTKQAVLTAPLWYAARSTHTLQVLLEFNVTFGRRSRINYYSHATMLWQAAWIRNGDMVRFLLDLQRYENRSTGGSHLYEVTRLKCHEPQPTRVLQWESAKDAKHKLETAGLSTTPDNAASVIYCERRGERDVWNLAYLDSKRKVVHLRCQAEAKHKELPWRFRNYCVVYNRHIRDQRHQRWCCANTCCKVHEKIPDDIFDRLEERDVYEQPPLTGWVQDGDDSDSGDAYMVQSTNLVKGWHPDYPPPMRGNDRRCSALGLAIYHDMDCVPELLNYGFKIDEVELNTAIKSGRTRNFLNLFRTAAKTSPDILLKLPQHTIAQCHPKLLQRMWTELKDDSELKGNMQAAVRNVMCGDQPKLKQMVWDFVRHAPQAAAIILDSFFLQIPNATSANRNPLSIHAWIHTKTGVNTQYVADPTWSFDTNTLQPPVWQSALTRDSEKREHSLRGSLCWSSRSSPYQIQMCDIRVVRFPGILSLDLFRSLCDLRYQQQVDLLDACVTMQAVVCHTWRKWALRYHKLLLVEEAIQFLALFAWGMSPDRDGMLHSCSWTVFSMTALGRLMQDAFMCCLNIVYMLRQWANVNVTSLGDVFNWWDVPSHVFSVYLISTFWTTIYTVEDDVQNEQANDNHLFWLGVGTVLKGAAVAHRLQTTSLVGHLLIPIRDVFRDSFITAMLVVLMVVVFIFMAFVYIAWKGASASEAKAAIVNTWVNFVIGEPVMLTGGDPDDFEHPWSQYVLVSVTHLAFTIALLNVLMAMTMETYRGMGLKATSRFLRARAELCRITLWKRRVLLTVFCNWLDLSVSNALFSLFVIFVFSSAVILLISDRFVIGLLVCGGGAEMLLTLLVLVADTPIKPNEPDQDKWWIEQHYLWVCTPREEDTRQEEAARALQQLCQGDAAETLARLARRGMASPATAPGGEDVECRRSLVEQPTLADVMSELTKLRTEVAELSERQQRREELT